MESSFKKLKAKWRCALDKEKSNWATMARVKCGWSSSKIKIKTILRLYWQSIKRKGS